MYDIVHNEKSVLDRCKELGITPLVIGKDVVLAKTEKDVKHAQALLVLATSAERNMVEAPVDGIVDIETNPKKDHFHFRRGGLDQVNAKILSDNKRAYVVSLQSIREAKDRAILIGRIQANAAIAKKLKTPVIFASFAKTPNDLPTPADLHAFFRGIDIDQELVQKSPKQLDELVKRAEKRASPSYIAEGVQKVK